MRIPPPQIGTPKRKREGDATSENEEMKDPDPKRRTSAVDREDQDMEDPPSEPGPSATGYGTAPRPQSGQRYSLRDIAKNPLRDYPSAMAMEWRQMERFWSFQFSRPILWKGGTPLECSQGEKMIRPPVRWKQLARSAPQQKQLKCVHGTRYDRQLKSYTPFQAKTTFFTQKLPTRRVVAGSTKHMWSDGTRLGPMASGHWSNLVEDKDQPRLPPLLLTVNWRELVPILQAHLRIGLPASVNADGNL